MTDVFVSQLHSCQHCIYETSDEAEMCLHLEKEHGINQEEVEVEYE